MTKKSYSEAKSFPKYGSISTIISQIPKGSIVLDVGCSDGYLAKHLEDCQVYGIDYNSDALKLAKNFCVKVKQVDLNKVEELDNIFHGIQFDYIVFADVLEHILYPELVLQYMKTKLSSDGYIITSLPNVALWRVRLQLLFGQFNYSDYGVLDNTHLHLYTFKSAKKLLENNGLRIYKTFGAANFLGPTIHYLPFLRTLLSIHIIHKSKP
jgi:O-antigen biosynthesis protein